MRAAFNPFPLFNKANPQQSAVATIYDSPSDFVDTISGFWGMNQLAKDMMETPSFYSNETWSDMKRNISIGSQAMADKSGPLIDRIEAGTPATDKRVRVSTPVGRALPGAVAAGNPFPCRRRVKVKMIDAPLSIVVSTNSGGDVSASDLEKRGIAIAALVRKIVKDRPVNLYLSRFNNVSGRKENICAFVRFNTTPLSVNRLAYLLSSQGFCRGAMFAATISTKDTYDLVNKSANNPGREWQFIGPAGGAEYSQRPNCPFAADLKTFFKTDILYLPGAYSYNPDYTELMADPVKWVNSTMAKLRRG